MSRIGPVKAATTYHSHRRGRRPFDRKALAGLVGWRAIRGRDFGEDATGYSSFGWTRAALQRAAPRRGATPNFQRPTPKALPIPNSQRAIGAPCKVGS